MKLTLLDINKPMCDAWEKHFKQSDEIIEEVKIVNSDFHSYCKDLYNRVGGDFYIVSPANSFGMMDGGYDLAITNFYKELGVDIIKEVQQAINIRYLGEQPVGTCLKVFINQNVPRLYHIPTMRYPMNTKHTNIPYMCMKELLHQHNSHLSEYEVIIPSFNGGCGGMLYEDIAYQMELAHIRFNECSSISLGNWNEISNEVAIQNKMKR